MYLEVSHASHPKRAEFQCSPIFVVLLGGATLQSDYGLYVHRLTLNSQIRRGNTYWDGRTTLLHLHKCVTWFVKDQCYIVGADLYLQIVHVGPIYFLVVLNFQPLPVISKCR